MKFGGKVQKSVTAIHLVSTAFVEEVSFEHVVK